MGADARKVTVKEVKGTVNNDTNEDTAISSDCAIGEAESVDTTMAEAGSTDQKKSGRKRKRHFYNALRTQMEFYFGDANLSKDRFLKQLIDKDPFVPLDTFLSFNKMKILTNSTDQIAKSLSNSQLLELDETMQRVRRKTALPAERNVDEKTLYVEALPTTADHEWIRSIFERFGTVAYVSLPKYTKSRKIKEFAFVEFERENSVEKAVKAFKQFNGLLSVQEMDPAELCSVKAFISEQEVEQRENVEGKTHDEKSPHLDMQNDAPGASKKSKKRRNIDTEVFYDEGAPVQKKLRCSAAKLVNKQDEEEEESDNAAYSGSAADIAAVTTETEQSSEEEDGENNDGAAMEVDKKKRRRKKRKKAKLLVEQLSSELKGDTTCFDLKILPKRDWKRVRNKYLNLQRAKVAELKRKLWNRGHAQHKFSGQQQEHLRAECSGSVSGGGGGVSSGANAEDDGGSIDDAEAEIPKNKSKLDPPTVGGNKLHKMHMNFYGAGSAETDESQVFATAATTATKQANARDDRKPLNPAQERTPLFTYEPGLIIELIFLEPCVSVKDFKADMRQYPSVKYIDIKEGAMHANLRIETPAAAEEFVRQVHCAEYKCKILKGKAETRYWRKIEQDRETKLNKKIKVPQKRGREKVKKMLAKHVRFGDDEDVDEVVGLGAGGGGNQVNVSTGESND